MGRIEALIGLPSKIPVVTIIFGHVKERRMVIHVVGVVTRRASTDELLTVKSRKREKIMPTVGLFNIKF